MEIDGVSAAALVGRTAHRAVVNLWFGGFTLDGNIVEAGSVSTDALIIQRAGSTDIDVAVNVADAAGNLGDIAGTVHYIDRDIAVGIVGHITGEAAALILCGYGLRCGFRRRGSLNVHIRRAGAGGLTGIVEGAVGTPAVHIPCDICDAERRTVLTGHGGIEHTCKILNGILTAVRADESPGERVVYVGAGDKIRGSALLLVFIGRVLCNGQIGGFGVLRSRSLGGNRRGDGITLQGCRLRDRKYIRQLFFTGEDGVAVSQTGEGSLVEDKPVKACVALLR